MPGVADYHQHPAPQRLRNALIALGQFHVAAAPDASDEQARIPDVVAARSARIREWLERPRTAWLERIDAFSAGSDTVPPVLSSQMAAQLAAQAYEVLTHFQRLAPMLARELAAWNQAVPIQPCIRDVWHDHVLFEGDRVSGLIDFGAMQWETVAGDVARLLGSLVGDAQSDWEMGLNAYESVRPLSHAERQLVPLLDRASALLSPMNWIQWLCVERRTFDHPQQISQRIAGFLTRLRRLSTIDLD
jgi:homoserine kinase type II